MITVERKGGREMVRNVGKENGWERNENTEKGDRGRGRREGKEGGGRREGEGTFSHQAIIKSSSIPPHWMGTLGLHL